MARTLDIYDDLLTADHRTIADLLANRKPLRVAGDVMQATAGVYWYALVRDMADNLFTRPSWDDGHRQTRKERQWNAFTTRANYHGADGEYRV